MLLDIDAGGAGVGEHPHAGGGQVGGGAMGQVGPVGDFPGDVVRDAADGEVGIGVGDDHGDLGGGVEFAGAQRRADAGITATDSDDMTSCHAGLAPDGVMGVLAVRVAPLIRRWSAGSDQLMALTALSTFALKPFGQREVSVIFQVGLAWPDGGLQKRPHRRRGLWVGVFRAHQFVGRQHDRVGAGLGGLVERRGV